MPSFFISALSRTLHLSPTFLATSCAYSATRVGVAMFAGSFARSRVRFAPSAAIEASSIASAAPAAFV